MIGKLHLLVTIALVILAGQLYAANLHDRQKLLQILKQYSPDSYYILSAYEKAPRRYTLPHGWINYSAGTDFMTYIKRQDDFDVLDDLSTAVHEINHGLTAIPLAFVPANKRESSRNSLAIFLGGNSMITVPKTATFPSRRLAATIPPDLRTFRFETYIDPKDAGSSTQSEGIYGLLDELNAYYHGTRTAFDLYRFYKDELHVSGRQWFSFFTNFEASYYAHMEFKFFILKYLLFAQQKEPDIFSKIINNQPFCTAFLQVDHNFTNLIQNYNALRKAILDEIAGSGHEVREDEETLWIDNNGIGTFHKVYMTLFNELKKPQYQNMYALVEQHAHVGQQQPQQSSADRNAQHLQAVQKTPLPTNPPQPQGTTGKAKPGNTPSKAAGATIGSYRIRSQPQTSASASKANPMPDSNAAGNASQIPPSDSTATPAPHQKQNMEKQLTPAGLMMQEHFAGDWPLDGVGISAGFIQPGSGLEAAPALCLFLSLGKERNPAVGARFDFWSKSIHNVNEKTNWKAADVSLFIKGYLLSKRGILPFLGGGMGVSYSQTRHRATAIDTGAPIDNWHSFEFFIKLDAFAGVTIPLSSTFHSLIEVKYTVEDINSFGIYLGVEYKRPGH